MMLTDLIHLLCRADTLELAKRVNEYQGRMRAVTRKVMAIVSELSMYQATSLKLGAEKDDLEATVSDTTLRVVTRALTEARQDGPVS